MNRKWWDDSDTILLVFTMLVMVDQKTLFNILCVYLVTRWLLRLLNWIGCKLIRKYYRNKRGKNE